MKELAAHLFLYGPLGILCLVLLRGVIVLYKAKERQAKEFQEKIAELQKAHQDEMTAMVQRHIGKAETWVEKGNELASNLTGLVKNLEFVVESLLKRLK